tara:strand:+ start:14326 stop:15522 length:1197 start_codon:yes stop_codon:yes gene_type:complete
MSSDNNLQEMEAGTTQSKTAVNAGAKAGDPMQKLAPGAVAGQTGSYEDLGGPTPDNYKSDDESAKLKTPGATLKQVRDVVNKGAKPADAMKGMKEEEELESEEVIEEDEEVTAEAEEVVSEEEEATEEEVVSEEEESEEEVVAEAEEIEEEEEFDVSEDVTALLEGEELSEEFQEKARTIFEAALRSKVEEIKEGMIAAYDEAYEERLVEEVTEIKTALQERVDSYLEYVAEEWVTENRLAIESGLKAEMSESFLSGMKTLFEEHYVSIPEEKYDVLESMVEKLDEMETKLNEQIEKNITLNSRLSESVADGIFDEVAEGLALSQKEKLASLAESVEFESGDKYREKLEMLKESYFTAKKAPKAQTENLSEEVDIDAAGNSPDYMNSYLRTLGAVSKK